MNTFARKMLLVILATSLPVALFAQDELLDEEQVPIKFYTVELIVFSYAENVGVGSEVFPADLIEPPSEDIQEIVVEPRNRKHPDAIGLEPVFLTEEELTMHDVLEHLERLDAYTPLMHVGWTQPGFPLQDTDALDLTVFGEPPIGLNGNFTLYLARYLHLVVDLAMDAPVEVVEFEFDDEPAYSLEDIGVLQGPVRFRIQEDRIVKNGETRYFDHPKFGVVARVVRVEESEAEEEAEETLLSRTVQ